ncbi:hypothetical protein GCM10028808_60740 [Spirosoma migulaei]
MINLNHIQTLTVVISSAFKNQVEGSWYNSRNNDQALCQEQLVELTKIHLQAQNLYTKLDSLHRVCTDFAAGHFQAYIEEHNRYQQRQPEAYRVSYEPINELHACFSGMMADGLPTQIEQYSELLTMAHDFSSLREALRPYQFEVADSTGYLEILAEEELPDETRLQLVAEEQIQDIEIEFCLDDYNQFYQQATGFLTVYEVDAQACAQALLNLYSPVQATDHQN